MPVDLRFGNNIIDAYSKGIAERQQQEAILRQKVQQAQDNADKQTVLKQAQQRIDLESEQHHALIDQENANRQLEAHKIAAGDQQTELQTGQTPPGYNTGQVLDPTTGQLSDQRFMPNTPGASYTPIDPAIAAQRQVQIQGPALDAAMNRKIAETKATNDAEQVRQLAVAVQHGIDQKTIQDAESERAIKVANINGASRIKAAGVRAAVAKNTTLNANGMNTIAGQYDKDPILKAASDLATNVADVARIDPKTQNQNEDQKLLFTAGILVNPKMGVRGYEYNTLKDNAQSIADKVGINLSNFFDKHEALTTEARQKLKDFVIQGSQGQFDAADLQRNNYISRLKALAPDMPDDKVQALIGPALHNQLLQGTGYKRVESGLPTITTKAQYDSLAPGSWFMEDGHKVLKPKK